MFGTTLNRPRILVLVALVALAVLASTAAPALAGARIERELELTSGGQFRLDTDVGSVEIVGSGSSGARIVITSRNDEIEDHFDFEFNSSGDVVEVSVDKKSSARSWFRWGNDKNLRFEIQVPTDTSVDIDTAGGSIEAEGLTRPVRLDTSGGSIRARNIGGELIADTSGGSIDIEDVDGDVNADTSGGSISVEGVRGDLRADTSGGSIKVRDVSGDVRADTSGGSISILEAGGRVEADTSGGTVTVSFSAGNDRGGSISTSGGGVHVTLDTSVGLDIDAVASGGSVVSDIPITVQGKISKTSLRGSIGGGGESLRLRASGGKIRIEKN